MKAGRLCLCLPGEGCDLDGGYRRRQFLYRNDAVFSTAMLKMGRGNSGKLVSDVKLAMTNAAPNAELAIIDKYPGNWLSGHFLYQRSGFGAYRGGAVSGETQRLGAAFQNDSDLPDKGGSVVQQIECRAQNIRQPFNNSAWNTKFRLWEGSHMTNMHLQPLTGE